MRYLFNSDILVSRQMENSSTSDEEEAVNVDLIEGVYLYLTESRYPQRYSVTNERAVRKKAQKFVVRHCVLFFKKKKRGKVRSNISRLFVFSACRFP